MIYIATFYSHFGAIRFKRLLEAAGCTAKLQPVPRALSSSCGTCVRYEGDKPCPDSSGTYPEELEQVVLLEESGSYQVLYRALNS